MKKLATILICLAMLFSCLALTAAASDKTEVLDALKAAMPEGLSEEYYIMAENVLNQIDVTAEQKTQLLTIIDDLKEESVFYGNDFNEYPAEMREYIVSEFNAACDVLDIVVVSTPAAKPQHAGDVDISLYTKSGTLLAEIDTDSASYVNKTNVPDFTGAKVAGACAMLLIAMTGAAVVVSRRKLVNAL